MLLPWPLLKYCFCTGGFKGTVSLKWQLLSSERGSEAVIEGWDLLWCNSFSNTKQQEFVKGQNTNHQRNIACSEKSMWVKILANKNTLSMFKYTWLQISIGRYVLIKTLLELTLNNWYHSKMGVILSSICELNNVSKIKHLTLITFFWISNSKV